MFQRRRSTDKSPIDPTNPKTTTLAKDLVFEGRVRTPGDAIVWGTLQGDLEVGGRLRAMPGSHVQGTVMAAEAHLQGTVDGPVTVTGKLEIAPTGRVEGDVQAGTLAIAEVMGHRGGLVEVVGTSHRLVFEGHRADVIPLPHPSGASTWHRMEPGKTLLGRALALLAAHPEVKRAFGPRREA